MRALSDVQLSVQPGSVHALVGENGAGKSTLMKILLGIYRPDSGSIEFDGQTVSIRNVNSALRTGISMIHQELSPVPELTVAENIFLGREPTYPYSFWLNRKRMIDDSERIFRRLEVAIDPRTKMKDLSVANTQIVEIAKAISYDSSLLIMDEPTSALTETEASHLLTIIDGLRQNGTSIIYISHKLNEILSIADEITILRDGEYIETVSAAGITSSQLVEMMVGRQLDQLYPKEEATFGDVCFEADKITLNGVFQDISFQVRRGEIVGVAGLMGAGRTEVIEAIFGLRQLDSGKLSINGRQLNHISPAIAIENGMALLTEDRKLTGLFLPLNVRENISMASIERFKRPPFLDHRKVNTVCKEQVETLGIKTPSLSEAVQNLSGGNQQKVLIARWLLTDPEILFLDEPTRGIDVGGKAEIHRLITGLASNGKAIVMISSEMHEIMGISDRIIVIHEGRISGTLTRDEATQERIMKLAMGLMEND